jgi:hypothetical protein
MPVGLRALHAWWPRGRNAKDYVNTFIPIRAVVGNIAATVMLWITPSSAKSTCRSSVWSSIVGVNKMDCTCHSNFVERAVIVVQLQRSE